MVSLVLAVGGAAVAMDMKALVAMVPLAAIVAGSLPLVWLWWRRKRRLDLFNTQLPDALEMIARALRAGQSLAFGFNAVAAK